MSPLNEEQQLQIRDERREQIISAALKVFARRGIIGTKMSMIAAEAEISHGLLYHYFSSKEELFTTLVERAMLGSDEAMQSVCELPGSPLAKIRALTQDMMDEGGTDYFLLIHQARTSDGVPEKVEELMKLYSMDRYVKQLRALFRDGQEAGELADGDADEMIASYLSVLSGLMVLHVHKGGGYRLPSVDVLLRMITR